IPEEGIGTLSEYLGCSQAQLFSMATFYKALSLTPKGEHIIKICNGTACHLRGSMNLVTELKRDLGIDPGQTTEDGAFSIDLVNCLGSCALAPVMVVDGTYHNKLKVEQVPGIIQSYAAKGKEVTEND
ncbi:MAG: NAD(P)H-dependent oxidoreductase subunit E, partial [Eggerthellaceae bacterium]|nr:NAD(P)H-dependent oxidoreductase subunit E [Eggerthellaceae bacterium]